MNNLRYEGYQVTKQEVVGDLPMPWHPIVSNLIDDLFELGWDGDIHQVKEKFGALRFYIGQGSDEIFDRIDEAEGQTRKVCINCGKDAVGTSKGWVRYLCAKCLRKSNES